MGRTPNYLFSPSDWLDRHRLFLSAHDLAEDRLVRSVSEVLARSDVDLSQAVSAAVTELRSHGVGAATVLYVVEELLKSRAGATDADAAVGLFQLTFDALAHHERSLTDLSGLYELSKLTESGGPALAVFTPRGILAGVNPAMRTLLGGSYAAEYIGNFNFTTDPRITEDPVLSKLAGVIDGRRIRLNSCAFDPTRWRSALGGRQLSAYAAPLLGEKITNGFLLSLGEVVTTGRTDLFLRFTRNVELLAHIASTVGLESDLETACTGVLGKLTERVFDAAALFLADGQELILHLHKNLPDAVVRRQAVLEFGDTNAGKAVSTGKMVVTTADRTLGEDVRLLEQTGYKARIDIPVIFHTRVVGLLTVMSKEEILLNQDLRVTLRAVASQLALGIENHRLMVKLQRDAVKLEIERDFTQGMMDAMGGMVLALDRDMRVEYYNERYHSLTRFTGEEVTGRVWSELVHSGHDAFMNVLRESVEFSEPRFCECQWKKLDSRPFPGYTGVCPLHGPDGRLTGYVVTVADLTERNTLEELTLKQNEELQLLNNITTVLSRSVDLAEVGAELIETVLEVTGGKFGVLYLSEAPDSPLQARASVGLDDSEIVQVEFADCPDCAACTAVHTGKPVQVQTSEDAHDAVENIRAGHSLLVYPLPPRGGLTGALVLARRGKRKFSRETLRWLDKSAPQMMLCFSNLLLVDHMSAEAMKTEGLSEISKALLSETLDDRFTDLALERTCDAMALDLGCVVKFEGAETRIAGVYPESVEEWAGGASKHLARCIDLMNEDEFRWIEDVDELKSDELVHALAGANARSAVLYPISVEGRRVAILVLVQRQFKRRWRSEDRSFVRVIADQLGIAYRKTELFRQLSRANAELRTLDEMKSNLLANVSHELRTPLVSVRGYIEMTLQGMLGTISDRQKKGLEIAIRNVDRLVALIENLLNFAKLETGLDNLQLMNFPLVDLVETVARSFKPQVRERKLDLRLEIPKDIRLTADQEKMARLLINLIDNATKFAPSGGKVLVKAGLKPDRGRVVIEVHDSGPGVPPSERERVFDRFYQVDPTSTRKYGGTGIGLAICRDIVRLHGGEVQVQASPLGGAAFVVMLPLVLTEKPGSAAGRDSRKLPPLIMLNLANPEIAESIENRLRKGGLNTLQLEGLNVALHGALRHRPHTVVSDLGWAEDGCFKLLHALRGNLGGEEAEFVINRFFPVGADRFYWFDDFLPSPLPVESLRRLIVDVPEDGSVLLLNADDQLIEMAGILCMDRGVVLMVADGDAGEVPPPRDRYDLVLFDVSHAHRRLLQLLGDYLAIAPAPLPRVVALSRESRPVDRDEIRLIKPPTGHKPVTASAVARAFSTHFEATEPGTSSASRSRRGTKRVLVIDDEEEILELISLLLEPAGWEIATLSSGVGAVETVFRMKPDLILLDIAMPGMDGIEVLENLASDGNTASIPVVVVSARTDDATIKQARAAGARHCIAKPFRNADLLKVVESMITRKK